MRGRCAPAVGEAPRAVSCPESVGLTRSSWLPPPQKALGCRPHRRCLAPSSLAGFTARVSICPSGWSCNWSAGIKSETPDSSYGAPDDGGSGSGSPCAVHSPVRPLLGVGGSMGGFAAGPAIHPVARASRHIRGRKADVIGYVDGLNMSHAIEHRDELDLQLCDPIKLLRAGWKPTDGLVSANYYAPTPRHREELVKNGWLAFIRALGQLGVRVIRVLMLPTFREAS